MDFLDFLYWLVVIPMFIVGGISAFILIMSALVMIGGGAVKLAQKLHIIED